MATKAKCAGCSEPWEFVAIVVECEEGPARAVHCTVCGFIASLEPIGLKRTLAAPKRRPVRAGRAVLALGSSAS